MPLFFTISKRLSLIFQKKISKLNKLAFHITNPESIVQAAYFVCLILCVLFCKKWLILYVFRLVKLLNKQPGTVTLFSGIDPTTGSSDASTSETSESEAPDEEEEDDEV